MPIVIAEQINLKFFGVVAEMTVLDVYVLME
jgi:hypothetical protein